jgi:phosphate transport system substrate-binding protein
MGRPCVIPCIALCATLGAPVYAAVTRDQIVIVGSSTVYPFSEIVAEHFAKSGPFPMPMVRSTSTAEGFKQLCAGNGTDTPDISNASRRITAQETALCAANGVKGISEVQIGYDSLILANQVAAPTFNVTLEQLWRAAARMVPINGRFVPNPYRLWSDIHPTLPNQPIQLFGPGPGHGTRDAFVELVMQPSCAASAAGSKTRLEELEANCGAIRNDGHWEDVEDLELVLGKLARNPQAMGVLTYSYLEQFRSRIHAASIEGITPTRASVTSASYPISRPLFIYVKNEHLSTTTGLADYTAEFVSFCAAGTNGYLSDEGLVPMPPAELRRQRAIVARLQR